MRIFLVMVATILMSAVNGSLAIAQNYDAVRPQYDCSHNCWLHPVNDCLHVPEGAQRDACSELAEKINAECGFIRPASIGGERIHADASASATTTTD